MTTNIRNVFPRKNDRPQSNIPYSELHSEEVQDVLGKMPGWTIRWGITVIFFVMVTVGLGSWFIRYPDTVSAQITLTTKIPPAPIIAQTNGRLELYAKDNHVVNKGQVLGVLENTANYKDIIFLQQKLKTFSEYKLSDTIQLISLFQKNLDIGPIQTIYQSFLSSLKDYIIASQLMTYEKQISEHRNRIHHYKLLNRQLSKRKKLLTDELGIIQKQFDREQGLFDNSVIAEVTLEDSKSALLKSKGAYENAEIDIINNQIAISQLQAQITNLELEQIENKKQLTKTIYSVLQQLKSELNTWQKTFLLISPVHGKVSLSKYWSNVQFVTSGEEVMTVIPESLNLYGKVLMPINGSGKVKIGQSVDINFENFPSSEFGTVDGKIKSISAVPLDGMYTIEVTLPHGLVTNYQNKLPFQREMQGTVRIITEDLRLTERFFYQLRKVAT